MMGTAGRYLGSAVLLVALGLSPALGYATTFVLLGLAALAAVLLITGRFERAAHPSPTLPEGEASSGWARGWISPAALLVLACLLIVISAVATLRTAADLLPLLGLTAPLFYAPLSRTIGGADLTRVGIVGAFVGLATALLYRNGLGMPRAAEGFWLTDPYRLAVTTLLAATLGLGVWFTQSRWRWLSVLALAAAIAVVALTGSRTALFGLPILLLITGLCLAHRPIARAAMVVAAIAVAIAALFIKLPGTERLRLWDALSAIASGTPVADPAIDIRISLANAATQLFASAPVFGYGWSEAAMSDVLALLTPAQLSWGRIPHLHSDVGQFAVSGGVFGLAVYALLLSAPIVGYLQLPREHRTRQRLHALLVLVIGATVLGLPDTFLAAPMTLTIYVVLTAAIAGANKERAG